MMATAKIALLMLVVFKTAALENSHEIGSNDQLHPYSSRSPSALPYPPFSSPPLAPSSPPKAHSQKISAVACRLLCKGMCHGKKSFLKTICMVNCLFGCVISPPSSLDDINCVIDCAQSSTSSLLRYDAGMIDDRGSSCSQQCKRD